MKIIAAAALVLGLSNGSALADHRHGGPWGRSSYGAWNSGGGWHGSVAVRPQWNSYRGHREYFAPRRPIFVRAPVIRERYFDFRVRPRILVENYAPMTGYYWVNGRWDWDGVEWRWTPGHYEPQANYVAPNYAPSYQPTYAPNYQPTYAPSYQPNYAPEYEPSDPNCDHSY